MKKLITLCLAGIGWTHAFGQENELFFRTQTEHQGTHFVPWGQYHYKKMTLEGRFNFDKRSSAAMLSGIQIGPKKLYCNISMGVLFGQHQGLVSQIKSGLTRYNCEIFSISEYVFGLKQSRSFALHSLTALWKSRRHFGIGIEEELRYFPPRKDAERVTTQEREFAVGPVAKMEMRYFFAEAWLGFGLYGNSRLHMSLGFKFE